MGQIHYNQEYSNQFKYAIEIIEKNDRKQKDSLGLIAINLLRYSDFDRQGNIYETTVNSGDIKLLRNNEIINALRHLEETYIYLNRMETIHFNALMSMVPDLKQAVRFTTNEVENIDILFHFEFQNLFTLSLRIMEEKHDIYDRAINEIAALNVLIDKQIDQ